MKLSINLLYSSILLTEDGESSIFDLEQYVKYTLHPCARPIFLDVTYVTKH